MAHQVLALVLALELDLIGSDAVERPRLVIRLVNLVVTSTASHAVAAVVCAAGIRAGRGH